MVLLRWCRYGSATASPDTGTRSSSCATTRGTKFRAVSCSSLCLLSCTGRNALIDDMKYHVAVGTIVARKEKYSEDIGWMLRILDIEDIGYRGYWILRILDIEDIGYRGYSTTTGACRAVGKRTCDCGR